MESLIVILFVIITMAIGIIIGFNGFALGGFCLVAFGGAIFVGYDPVKKLLKKLFKKLFKKW